MLKLTQLDYIPDELLSVSPRELYRVLPGPTLVHLEGRQPQPLFLCVLQHGNEHTGFYALQKVLKKYRNTELPRSLSIFFGNIEAARRNLRRLDEQVDYNRVWPGHQYGDCEESRIMQQVTDIMRERKVFVSLDIHNNTGLNPHYACINRLDPKFIYLANLFSRTIVYFTRPLGVQSMAFAELCPAVTVECGKAGQPYGEPHAIEYIEACLRMAELPTHDLREREFNIYSTVAIVRFSKDIDFSFSNDSADILLDSDLDYLNFRELEPGTRLGQFKDDAFKGVEVWNNDGDNVVQEFFQFKDNEIRLLKPVMPSMLTSDEHIIRQDCLCYLMEKHDLPELQ